jgi:hypothetical protein
MACDTLAMSCQNSCVPATAANDDCWYTMSKFRPLYPEYNNLSDYELIRMLYGIRVRPWATLGIWASIAVGIPLAALIIGASLPAP